MAQTKHFFRGEHAFRVSAGHGKETRFRAGGDENGIGGECFFADFYAVRVTADKRGASGVERDAGCAEQGGDAIAETTDDFFFATERVGMTVSQFFSVESTFGRENVRHGGTVTQAFRRDATFVETGSADVFGTVNDMHFQSLSSGLHGALIASGACADNDKFLHI